MNFDTLTLSAVYDELQCLVNGHIQRVLQLGPLTIGLEVFQRQRYQVLLSADATNARILVTRDKVRRGVETPSPFYLLLVKHLRGAVITGLFQPPYERVLEIQIEGAEGAVILVGELMGRYSNLILLDAQRTVMDAIKRIPPSLNRYRSVLPHQPYVAPPEQAKVNPQQMTTDLLASILSERPQLPAWRALVEGISGISPLLAHEIAYRALGESGLSAISRADLASVLYPPLVELLSLPSSHTWEPSLAFNADEQPIAFAAYHLTHLGRLQVNTGISEAIERYLESHEQCDSYRQVRQHLHQLLSEKREVQTARLAALQRALAAPSEIEKLRSEGNAILAMTWAITPRQGVLELDSDMASGLLGGEYTSPVLIPLDPGLTPAANAEKLFQTYRKKQAANAEVPGLIRGVQVQLAYLDQLGLDIDLAENRSELDAIERELNLAGDKPARQKARSRKGNLLMVRADDNTNILVGRSASQNEEITFRRTTSDDMWLHAHGVPGAHVIIKCGRMPIAAVTLEKAARYAAYYSGLRGELNVLVDYTQRRFVNHIPGGHPGMVTYRNERTITVPARLEDDGADQDAL
jgi:predicted ribosome quality control (RQC) complex YloA/Tae2 family protein